MRIRRRKTDSGDPNLMHDAFVDWCGPGTAGTIRVCRSALCRSVSGVPTTVRYARGPAAPWRGAARPGCALGHSTVDFSTSRRARYAVPGPIHASLEGRQWLPGSGTSRARSIPSSAFRSVPHLRSVPRLQVKVPFNRQRTRVRSTENDRTGEQGHPITHLSHCDCRAVLATSISDSLVSALPPAPRTATGAVVRAHAVTRAAWRRCVALRLATTLP